MRKAIIGILLFFTFCGLLLAQITGPSSIGFSLGAYQVTGENVTGISLGTYGWNLNKRAYLNRPARAVVRVDSLPKSSLVRWWYSINYEGRADTVEITIPRDAAFWIPDSQTAAGKNIPDSLFYIAPDTTGITAGDEFMVRNIRVRPADQYSFRLIFPTDTVKGTASLLSQPVWIGDGVSSFLFAYQPADTTGIVYRTQYATTYGGPYLGYASSDTIADSVWTQDSTEAAAWNYTTVTASSIDIIRWLKVQRIGKVAADTVKINGEILYIQSQ